MAAAAELARRLPRIVRLHTELFGIDESRLADLESAARRAGFTKSDAHRLYPRTVLLDLSQNEEAIFSALHSTARRHIRSQYKNPVEVRPIDSTTATDRLHALQLETLARTGGQPEKQSWSAILDLSVSRPDLSRLVGLFRTDAGHDGELLAYAWGCHHGDHAHYSTAASTRRTDLSVAMAYPLAWDLILWAREHGAAWFDFGGISRGTAGSGDPLGGISDFKRRFTKDVAEVASEWVYEPSPWTARVARVSSRLSRIRSLYRAG
jgi:lipid II:glycine glycyltransferase (peptidoglycan interpeptide bridge formation enzyme)